MNSGQEDEEVRVTLLQLGENSVATASRLQEPGTKYCS